MSLGGLTLQKASSHVLSSHCTPFQPPLSGLPMNSVQFSNHTGYGVCKGDVLQGEQLLTLVSVGYHCRPSLAAPQTAY